MGVGGPGGGGRQGCKGGGRGGEEELTDCREESREVGGRRGEG